MDDENRSKETNSKPGDIKIKIKINEAIGKQARLVEFINIDKDNQKKNENYVKPPPGSRCSVNEEEEQKQNDMKAMCELLYKKLSEISEKVVLNGRNTESPQGTMVQALDNSCVLFTENNIDSAKDMSSPNKSQGSNHVI